MFMMAAKNIININININIKLMQIRRRKGTRKTFTDASGSKGEKGRNARIVRKDFIQNLHACKKNRYDVSNTSAKQPWRLHPRVCK
jgi:hypothetical protein